MRIQFGPMQPIPTGRNPYQVELGGTRVLEAGDKFRREAKCAATAQPTATLGDGHTTRSAVPIRIAPDTEFAVEAALVAARRR